MITDYVIAKGGKIEPFPDTEEYKEEKIDEENAEATAAVTSGGAGGAGGGGEAAAPANQGPETKCIPKTDEGSSAELACAGKITEITFAVYGTPTG